eukprot:9633650-Lingulodinium_polyedra.AAC.1
MVPRHPTAVACIGSRGQELARAGNKCHETVTYSRASTPPIQKEQDCTLRTRFIMSCALLNAI